MLHLFVCLLVAFVFSLFGCFSVFSLAWAADTIVGAVVASSSLYCLHPSSSCSYGYYGWRALLGEESPQSVPPKHPDEPLGSNVQPKAEHCLLLGAVHIGKVYHCVCALQAAECCCTQCTVGRRQQSVYKQQQARPVSGVHTSGSSACSPPALAAANTTTHRLLTCLEARLEFCEEKPGFRHLLIERE